MCGLVLLVRSLPLAAFSVSTVWLRYGKPPVGTGGSTGGYPQARARGFRELLEPADVLRSRNPWLVRRWHDERANRAEFLAQSLCEWVFRNFLKGFWKRREVVFVRGLFLSGQDFMSWLPDRLKPSSSSFLFFSVLPNSQKGCSDDPSLPLAAARPSRLHAH